MCDAPLSYEHFKSTEHALFVTIDCSTESCLCCPLHTYQDASFAPLKICFLEEKKLRVKTISPHSISKKEVTSGKLYLILQTGNLGMWR